MSQMPAVNVMDPITRGASQATDIASLGAKSALDYSLGQQEIASREGMHAQDAAEREWMHRQEVAMQGQEASVNLARLRAMRAKGEAVAPALQEYGRLREDSDKSARAMMAAVAAKDAASSDKAAGIGQMEESAAAHSAIKMGAFNTVRKAMEEAIGDEATTGVADRFTMGRDLTGAAVDKGTIFDAVVRAANNKGGKFLKDEELPQVSGLLTKAWAAVADDGELSDDEVKPLLETISKLKETVPEEHLKGVIVGLKTMANALRKSGAALDPKDRKTAGALKGGMDAAKRLEEMTAKLEAAGGLDDQTVFQREISFARDVKRALGHAAPQAMGEIGQLETGVPEYLKPHFESVMGAFKTGMDQDKAIDNLKVIYHDQMSRLEGALLQAAQKGDNAAVEQLAPALEGMVKFLQKEAEGGR